MTTALIMFHVIAATISLLSGFAAMLFRKGSGLHGAAGTVFAVSMVAMCTSAAYIAAFLHPKPLNLAASTLTLYTVVTAWVASKRRVKRVNLFDAGALLWVVTVGIGALTARQFVFGTIALLFAAADVRMLVRGGVEGAQRVTRHLWRMCFSLLIATLSFYPGQAKLFPPEIRRTMLPLLPALLLIGSTIYWLVRTTRRSRTAART